MVCKSKPGHGDAQPTGQGGSGARGLRLLADAMLGRLAKWLRLLGFDTLYAGRRSDHQIAAIARAEGRVVLTRDREMMRRKGIRSLYVDSQVLEEQLKQVIGELGLSLAGESERRPARCPVCNQPLVRVSRDEVRLRVPPYVWQTQSLFHRCPECERIFWPGTHWEHIQETIERMIG
jgi:uncharacterized protein with PIN domain